jgi:hypothetical protein
MTNREAKDVMGSFAKLHTSEEYYTGYNIVNWLVLSHGLLNDALYPQIQELIESRPPVDKSSLQIQNVETIHQYHERRRALACCGAVWSKELWQVQPEE